MDIYTKTGDRGKTSLYDNTRLFKDDIRVESYGTIDELISFLGIAKNYVDDKEIYNILEEIQNKLFTVTTNLATKDKTKIKFYIEEIDIKRLEEIVDIYMGRLDNPKGFIVPGSSKKSAYVHVARTICRRGERRIITLARNEDIDQLVIKYVNRLSDTLYAIGRYLEEDEIKVKY
ncbi:cob(I)yrinic acid a,c-diamide adenosyltransferase [Tissierella creatinophila]|uniref:Corrinoid adenosyltransferase n=1 Tax=Tissierella creatinophila DSM 6911 TaxID=1123403 RepID=A0A1U7M6S5_TISCR|nr:cob(I)yrinic acid a,c-diamide adenosyltransferase [Tissierella creatinophila]OLS03022.1 Cob(I)yrinic acid a,c-diamide adenosyltransferase [Tissierella creatinophila DSM 6911]